MSSALLSQPSFFAPGSEPACHCTFYCIVFSFLLLNFQLVCFALSLFSLPTFTFQFSLSLFVIVVFCGISEWARHCCLNQVSLLRDQPQLAIVHFSQWLPSTSKIHSSELMSLFANLFYTQILVAEYHIWFTFIYYNFSGVSKLTVSVQILKWQWVTTSRVGIQLPGQLKIILLFDKKPILSSTNNV